jgi:hypothetical protein
MLGSRYSAYYLFAECLVINIDALHSAATLPATVRTGFSHNNTDIVTKKAEPVVNTGYSIRRTANLGVSGLSIILK